MHCTDSTHSSLRASFNDLVQLRCIRYRRNHLGWALQEIEKADDNITSSEAEDTYDDNKDADYRTHRASRATNRVKISPHDDNNNSNNSGSSNNCDDNDDKDKDVKPAWNAQMTARNYVDLTSEPDVPVNGSI